MSARPLQVRGRISVVGFLVVLLAGWLLEAGRAAGQPVESAPAVVIHGHTAPDNPLEFEWTIENHSAQPIVRFLTYHFLGKDVFPPAGWVKSQMTGNIGRGQKRERGILELTAERRTGGILPGASQSFRVRLDPTWTRAFSQETVEIEFGDGAIARIPGVACPAKAPFLRDNYPAVGLGAMFAIFLIARTARRRRIREQAEAAGGGLGA